MKALISEYVGADLSVGCGGVDTGVQDSVVAQNRADRMCQSQVVVSGLRRDDLAEG